MLPKGGNTLGLTLDCLIVVYVAISTISYVSCSFVWLWQHLQGVHVICKHDFVTSVHWLNA